MKFLSISIGFKEWKTMSCQIYILNFDKQNNLIDMKRDNSNRKNLLMPEGKRWQEKQYSTTKYLEAELKFTNL